MTNTLLLAAALLIGALHLIAGFAGWTRSEFWSKPIPIVLLLLLVAFIDLPVSNLYRILILVGLLSSLAGDIFLELPGNWFIQGLVAFLIAHIFYIVAYQSRTGFHLTPAILLIFAIYGALMLWFLLPHVGAMQLPVIVYMAVILVMGWQAAEQWTRLRDLSSLLALVGALLFIVSDSALAWNRFRNSLPASSLLIMSTYYLAQALIALSVRG